MKKLILISVSLVFCCFVAFPISLKDVFNELSKVPNIEITDKEPPETIVFDKETYTSGWLEIAKASKLDAKEIKATGDCVMNILDKVALTDRIICSSNKQVGIFIYASPTCHDLYEMLLVTMSGYRGDVNIIYNTINEATLQSLQEASVRMQNSNLVVLPNRMDTIYVGGINEIVIEGPK